MTKIANWLGARLREPSTYAGAAAIFAYFGMNVDHGLLQNITMIGTGLGGVLAFTLPEKK